MYFSDVMKAHKNRLTKTEKQRKNLELIKSKIERYWNPENQDQNIEKQFILITLKRFIEQ